MVDFMIMLLNLSWKALCVVAGWLIIKYILRNGTGTVKEILDTIFIGIRAMARAIRMKLYNYLKKEEASTKPVDKQAATAAYNEYLKKCRAECMTFEEFTSKMANGDTFTID